LNADRAEAAIPFAGVGLVGLVGAVVALVNP